MHHSELNNFFLPLLVVLMAWGYCCLCCSSPGDECGTFNGPHTSLQQSLLQLAYAKAFCKRSLSVMQGRDAIPSSSHVCTALAKRADVCPEEGDPDQTNSGPCFRRTFRVRFACARGVSPRPICVRIQWWVGGCVVTAMPVCMLYL